MEKDANTTIHHDGIPASLFYLMCSLSCLGVVLSAFFITFHLLYHKNRLIKITSPNMGIVISIGCVAGYVSMVIFGIDSSLVSMATMSTLQQAGAYVLSIAFTVIFGSLFTKTWRIFMIFKSINFNGKMSRDEHLLLAVFCLISLDVAILVPWTITDPVTCLRRTLTQSPPNSDSTAVIEIDDCFSDFQVLWVLLLYGWKFLLLLVGLLLTWQTRHVTLPSLRDTKIIYIVVMDTFILAVICLPLLLVNYTGMKIKYSIGACTIWLAVTSVQTLLFAPKIILLYREQKRSSPDTANKQLFMESMKRTREAVRNCTTCFCCGPPDDQTYAQEMLTSEIEELKTTIKQKDSTIRELNDRLNFGVEKFQEYLRNPPKHQRGNNLPVTGNEFQRPPLPQSQGGLDFKLTNQEYSVYTVENDYDSDDNSYYEQSHSTGDTHDETNVKAEDMISCHKSQPRNDIIVDSEQDPCNGITRPINNTSEFDRKEVDRIPAKSNIKISSSNHDGAIEHSTSLHDSDWLQLISKRGQSNDSNESLAHFQRLSANDSSRMNITEVKNNLEFSHRNDMPAIVSDAEFSLKEAATVNQTGGSKQTQNLSTFEDRAADNNKQFEEDAGTNMATVDNCSIEQIETCYYGLKLKPYETRRINGLCVAQI